MRYLSAIIVLFFGMVVSAQTVLTYSGQTYTNSDDTWLGVNVPRSAPTTFVFKNNSISSINTAGYMLQAGDENIRTTSNNLDGMVITGNKLSWSGGYGNPQTHGIFTGNNINASVKYNYCDNVSLPLIAKSSSSMVSTSGSFAYNIVKCGLSGTTVKGISGIKIFNNTYYQDKTTTQTWRGIINIYTNIDGGLYSVAHGTKIFNNVFYAKYGVPMICIEDTNNESLVGFESDYNVFYCETTSVKFKIGSKIYTFAQWQALGYDTHSIVLNPNFKDFTRFVPATRLNYGTDLGSAWLNGLSPDAVWGTIDPKLAAQNGTWQAGAIVYGVTAAQVPVIVSSAINNDTPAILETTYDLTLANSVTAPSAFSVQVNSATRNVNTVAVSGTQVSLTLASQVRFGDVVTVSYIKPASNPLQTVTGATAETIIARPVTNMVLDVTTNSTDISGNETMSVYPNPAREFITISNLKKSQERQVIRIFDLSGKLCMEVRLEPGINNKIPVNLKSGFYVIQLSTGPVVEYIQKLVVVE